MYPICLIRRPPLRKLTPAPWICFLPTPCLKFTPPPPTGPAFTWWRQCAHFWKTQVWSLTRFQCVGILQTWIMVTWSTADLLWPEVLGSKSFFLSHPVERHGGRGRKERRLVDTIESKTFLSHTVKSLSFNIFSVHWMHWSLNLPPFLFSVIHPMISVISWNWSPRLEITWKWNKNCTEKIMVPLKFLRKEYGKEVSLDRV